MWKKSKFQNVETIWWRPVTITWVGGCSYVSTSVRSVIVCYCGTPTHSRYEWRWGYSNQTLCPKKNSTLWKVMWRQKQKKLICPIICVFMSLKVNEEPSAYKRSWQNKKKKSSSSWWSKRPNQTKRNVKRCAIVN